MPSRDPARNLTATAILLTGLLGWGPVRAAPALGQEPPSVQSPAVEAEPGPIPSTALISRAAETEALLQRARDLVRPDIRVDTIREALDDTSGVLQGMRQELDALDPVTVAQRRLTDQSERWLRARERVDGWSSTLQARWEELVDMRDAVQLERRTWALTREQLVENGLGGEVVQSVDDLLIRVETSLRDLGAPIETLTELIVRANRRLATIEGAIADIDELSAGVRQRLLQRDHPPLWRAPVAGLSGITAEVREGARYWWRTGREWAAARRSHLLVLGLAFLALLTGALVLRSARHSWPDDPAFADAVFVVSRPVAIAGLATLGISVLMFDPANGPLRDIVRIAAIAATARLGHGLARPVPRGTFFGAVALLGLVVATGFLPNGAIIGRVAALLVAALAAVWVVRARRTWPVEAGTVWRLTRAALAATLPVLAVGALADILGWVDLGTLLIAGTVTTTAVAFAWMVLVHAVRGLLPLLRTGFIGTQLRIVTEHRRLIERAILVPVILVAVYGWTTGALRTFRLQRLAQLARDSILDATLTAGSLEISVGGVLAAVVILMVTVLVARVVRFVLAEEIFVRLRLRPGTRSTLVSLINYVILALGIVMAATAAGFNATQLTVVVGALSVGIGFGLQAVVSNFISGLILLFERPVAVGDQVEAAGYLGTVTNIGIRASQIRTFDGSEVIIPNSELITQQVVNWTLTDGTKRRNIDIAVGPESDPRLVMQTLEAVAGEHDLVLPEPAPRALMVGYGDTCINFRLQVWLRVEHVVGVPSELNVTIIERLRAANVEIPAIHRERQT